MLEYARNEKPLGAGCLVLTLLQEVAVIRLGKKTSTLGGVRGG